MSFFINESSIFYWLPTPPSSICVLDGWVFVCEQDYAKKDGGMGQIVVQFQRNHFL